MLFCNDIENTLSGENVSIGKLVGYSSKIIHATMNQAFSDAGIELNMELYILLRILSMRKNVIQQDLAKAIQKDKSSILRIINSLETKLWVARIQDQTDKRRNYLVLTQYGIEVLNEALIIEQKMMTELKEGITDLELESLKSALHKIRQNAYKTIQTNS